MIFKQLPTMISDLNKLGIALKSLDAMNIGSVGVNLANLEAYRTALKGLSVEQSVFALASKGATEEQIRQILVTNQAMSADVEAALAKAGLTTATQALNAEEMIALATKRGITTERAKEIASALGLIATEEGQIISKKQLTVATLQQAGATDAEITAMLGLNAVETTNIGITNVLTASFAKLWAVITAHPIGAIITAIGAVAVGTIAYINKVNKDAEKALVEAHENAEKALEDTKTSLSDDKSELQSVNSELETTKEKIKEISSIGAPTLTEQNELNKLSTANAQLEAQKTLLENNIKLKQKSAALDAKELLGTQVEMEYSSILDNSSITSKKESYTYADHAKYQASNLKNAYNIYMKALEEGNVKRQELAQELIDASAGDTAELTSKLLEIVESFKYDDGTIIDGYEDIYNEYMGMIYNLQSLTNPDTFLDIAKSITVGTGVDYEKAISEAYALAYEGNFDVDNLNQDFVKALADAGIDESTIDYIFSLKQKEYQLLVDKINNKYKVSEVPDKIKQDYWDANGNIHSEYVDVDEETKNRIEEINTINQSLNDYAKENPVEFQLVTSYDEGFTLLDKYIEEEKKKAENNTDYVGDYITNAITRLYDEAKVKSETFNNETDILSFNKAWKQLKNGIGVFKDNDTVKSTYDDLISLAESGQLTVDAFKNTTGSDTFLDQICLSAEEAIGKINQLVESSDQLSSMKSGIGSIADALGQKKENLSKKFTRKDGIGADTLAGFDVTIKGLDSWDDFEEKLGNGNSSMETCQKAANKLATEWVNSNNFLSQLDETNKDYYKTQLRMMGVENASQVVEQTLAQQHVMLSVQTGELTTKTGEFAQATKDELDILNLTSTQLDSLKTAYSTAQTIMNDAVSSGVNSRLKLLGIEMDTISSITDAYAEIANANGISQKNAKAYSKGKYVYDNGKWTRATTNDELAKEQGVLSVNDMSTLVTYGKQMSKINKIIKLAKKKIQITPTKTDSDSSSSGSSSGSDKNEKSKSTQIIDWIERRLSVLQTRIDQTKAKFENLYTFRAKKNNLDKQIKQTTALLDTQQKAVQKYKKKADSIKLDDDLKKKVQNGQITGSMDELIATYGEKKANQITKYQDYWDKYIELRKSVDETKKSLKEIRDERDQLVIDRADQNLSTIDAEEEIVGTAKKNNELEQQRVKWMKQSYDAQIRMAEREKDSVKIAELRAKKEKEILDVKKQILQNTLDENEAARNLNDAKAENTTDEKAKDKLAASNLKTYISDINAEKNYQNSIMKVANASDKEKKDIQNSIKATETMGQIAAISSKVLSQKDKDKIVSKIKKGKKIPDDLLKKVEKADVALYQKLTLYNSTLDSSDIQNLLTESETNIEEKKTAIRENIVNTLQRKSDNSEAKYNVLQAQQENVNTSAEKNKLEAESRENLKDQYAYQIAIAKVNGDINEALRLQEEYISKINDSYKKEYDNIKTEYDNINSLNESQISSVQSEISALEAQGKTVSTSFYQSLIGSTATSTNILTEEISKLEEKMADFDYGSEEWYSAKQDLESLNQSLLKNIESVAEFQKKINEIDLSKLNLQTKRLEYTAQQIEFLTDMLSHKDLTSEDAFGLTKEGFATLSLYLDKAQNSLNSVKTISEEWTTFQRQVALGVSNMTAEEIDEKNNEYAESMRSAIKANEEMKDSIKSLVKEAFDVEIDAINELIDKQKERLQKEKELYEYHKKITSQTKNIASLEKQIAALTGDTSEEARMKIQKLNVSLEDAREELQDTEYDQWISDQEDMLDNLAEELSDIFEDVLKNTDALIEQVRDAVTENSGMISDVLNQLGFGTTDLYKTITNADGSKTTETYNYDTGKTTYTDYDANGDLLRAYTMDSNLRNKLYDIFSDRKNFEEEGRTPYGDLTALMYNMLGRNDDGSFRELTLDGLKKVMDAFGMSYELAYAAADGDYSAQNEIAQLLKNAGFDVEKAQTDPLSVANGNWTSLTTNTTNISKDVGNIKTSLNQIYDAAKQYLTSQGIDVFSAFSSANGFATGGIAQASGILKKTGEDGFVLARNGEGFVRPEDVPAIKELMATVPTVNDMMGNIMSLRNIPTYAKEPSQSVNIGNYQQIIELPDVTDPKSFVKTFNNSREMQKAVQDATIKQTIKQYNNRLG